MSFLQLLKDRIQANQEFQLIPAILFCQDEKENALAIDLMLSGVWPPDKLTLHEVLRVNPNALKTLWKVKQRKEYCFSDLLLLEMSIKCREFCSSGSWLGNCSNVPQLWCK